MASSVMVNVSVPLLITIVSLTLGVYLRHHDETRYSKDEHDE